MHYDYTFTRNYCEQIGLVWFGDEYVAIADEDAYRNGFSQAQVDCAMKHTLLHVKTIFTPQRYTWSGRIILAFYFLTGWGLQ